MAVALADVRQFGATVGAALAKNSKHQLKILRGATNPNGDCSGWVLFIDGRRVDCAQKCIALLACLYVELGQIVPYKRLCPILGHKSAKDTSIHVLRQYMAWTRRTLAIHKSPYALAVAKDVGYALCEVSKARPRR
jgi:hypothetical protein